MDLDSEIELLERTLNRLNEGYGQILSLIGEAGLGKSRLIQEFHQRLVLGGLANTNGRSSEGFQWYLAESLSFEDSHPYGLFQRLLRRMVGISASDVAPAVILATVRGDSTRFPSSAPPPSSIRQNLARSAAELNSPA